MPQISTLVLLFIIILSIILFFTYRSVLPPARYWYIKSPNPLPLLNSRNDITYILVHERLKTGAEAGVKYGDFSFYLLSNWPNCTEYHAIDLWAQQEHYNDPANVDNTMQEHTFTTARKKLKRFEQIIRYHRNFSHFAARELKTESLDFIYLDARHDYEGVFEDLQDYWPKLKHGGVMAGHDYIDLDEQRTLDPKQDWSIDARGIKRADNKAVKSAVNDFARLNGRQVLQTLREDWPSWYMRK